MSNKSVKWTSCRSVRRADFFVPDLPLKKVDRTKKINDKREYRIYNTNYHLRVPMSKKKVIYPTLDPGQQTWSTFDIVKMLGIHRSRLREWLDRGFLDCGTRVQWGTSSKLRFRKYDLFSIKFFQVLVDSGMSRAVASRLTKLMNWQLISQNHYRYVVFQNINQKGEEKTLLKSAEPLAEIAASGLCIIINVKDILMSVEVKTGV
jgi:hypothetical protein